MLAFAQSASSWILPFVSLLLVVVVVHEFGHFLMARLFGIAIDEFSIGFGPAILSWRDRAGVEWRVGCLPLGGYVRFAGDDNSASLPDAEGLEAMRAEIVRREGAAAVGKYYHFKPIWQRAAVAAAGPFANFVLSTALFGLLLGTVGDTGLRPQIASVLPGSPAAAAGFKAGDLVETANGQPVVTFEELHEVVGLRAGVPMVFTVLRGTQTIAIRATPAPADVQLPVVGHDVVGQLGIAPVFGPGAIVTKRYDPVHALIGGAQSTWNVLSTTVYYLGRVVRGQMSTAQLSGPLGMAQLAHLASQEGALGAHSIGEGLLGSLLNLTELVALVSASIGFVNLLPIPILDGGHLVFYAYEWVARRPVAAAVQAASYRVGLALLLGLMLFATTNDLQRSHFFHFLGG
jgi:regulator of sigma E protease